MCCRVDTEYLTRLIGIEGRVGGFLDVRVPHFDTILSDDTRWEGRGQFVPCHPAVNGSVSLDRISWGGVSITVSSSANAALQLKTIPSPPQPASLWLHSVLNERAVALCWFPEWTHSLSQQNK